MVVRPGTRGEAAVSRAGQPGQGGALQGIDNTTSVVHPNGSGSRVTCTVVENLEDIFFKY